MGREGARFDWETVDELHAQQLAAAEAQLGDPGDGHEQKLQDLAGSLGACPIAAPAPRCLHLCSEQEPTRASERWHRPGRWLETVCVRCRAGDFCYFGGCDGGSDDEAGAANWAKEWVAPGDGAPWRRLVFLAGMVTLAGMVPRAEGRGVALSLCASAGMMTAATYLCASRLVE